MEVFQFVQRHKRMIIVVEIICIALFAAELLYLRKLGTFQPTPYVGLVILLPPFVATLLFFPLCYLAWFRAGSGTFLYQPKLIIFWLFALAFALIWLKIILASLGQLLE